MNLLDLFLQDKGTLFDILTTSRTITALGEKEQKCLILIDKILNILKYCLFVCLILKKKNTHFQVCLGVTDVSIAFLRII